MGTRSSKSTPLQAQTPKYCEFCVSQQRIHWKCVQCQKLICSRCKKVHDKIDVLPKHHVIDLRPKKQIEAPFLLLITCSNHTNEKYNTYCRTCDALICLQCVQDSHLGHDLGQLETSTAEAIEKSITLEVEKYFNTNLYTLKYIKMCKDGTAWILDFMSQVFQKVTLAHNIQLDIDIKYRQPLSLQITSDGTIILILSQDSNVYIMQGDGSFKVLVNLGLLYPIGLHITMDDSIIVSVMEKGGSYLVSKNSARKLMTFSKTGSKTNNIEFDENKKRLFNIPEHLTTTACGNICVVDHLSYRCGRITTVSPEGDLKWTYIGNPAIHDDRTPFSPVDIAASRSGFVVVREFNTNSVHILSANGLLMVAKSIRGAGNDILAMDIDNKGMLWIVSQDSNNAYVKIQSVNLTF